MHAVSSPYSFAAHRASRAFFLARTAQHVETGGLGCEIARAAVMLAGIASWGAVLLLLAG
jgi:hypothetical protein